MYLYVLDVLHEFLKIKDLVYKTKSLDIYYQCENIE